MTGDTPAGTSARTEAVFPLLSPGVLFTPTPDGGVVYDLVTEKLSFVNPSAAALCDACDRGLDPDQTVRGWAANTGQHPDRIRSDIDAALGQFAAAGFTGRTEPPPRLYPPDAPVSPLAAGEVATVQAAGVHRIRFRGVDATLVDAVADTLGLGSDDAPTADFHLIVHGDVDGDGATDASIRLVTDTEWRFRDRDELTGCLVTVVNDFVARTTTDAVLHAAALQSPAGATVVFPADPGSGKSTLAGTLIQHRWAYLGDESATIRTGDLAVVPCPKPVDLDATSCRVLGLSAESAGDVSPSMISEDARIVDTAAPPPTAIVLPCYVGPEATTRTTRLNFTDALVALVANTLNLRYVGTPGLDTLVALAATVPVHTITYRASDEAVALLAELGFDSPAAP